MSRYATTDQANRWARIRELLTLEERVLLHAALAELAGANRDTVATFDTATAVQGQVLKAFAAQAQLAEDMAGVVL